MEAEGRRREVERKVIIHVCFLILQAEAKASDPISAEGACFNHVMLCDVLLHLYMSVLLYSVYQCMCAVYVCSFDAAHSLHSGCN